MSRFARVAAKRDSAERAIIAILEEVGAEVVQLDQPVDLLVRYNSRWHLLEVKTLQPKRKTVSPDKRQKAQAAFIAKHRIAVVCTQAEALVAIGAIKSTRVHGAFYDNQALHGLEVTAYDSQVVTDRWPHGRPDTNSDLDE